MGDQCSNSLLFFHKIYIYIVFIYPKIVFDKQNFELTKLITKTIMNLLNMSLYMKNFTTCFNSYTFTLEIKVIFLNKI